MSLVYHITLHSPMGPRLGLLKLPAAGEPPLAAITLLRRQNQVEAQQPVPGNTICPGSWIPPSAPLISRRPW